MSRKFSNFVDLLRDRSLEQHEKIVFTFLQDGETESGSLTYQQLDTQARAIASRLQSLKATGERALLLYPPGLEFISAFMGCLYAGVLAVPAYPPRPNRSLSRLQAIVSDAEANFALTTESLLSTIEGRLTQSVSTEAIRCLTTDDIDCQLAEDWQETNLTENDLAFIQYTSGSTGTPKGVMVTHGNLLHNSSLINQCFQDTPESQGVSWLPPYHDMGLIGGILQPIYVGASMVLMSPVAFLQRPIRWLEAISRCQATTSGAPNFAYDLCVEQISPEQRETLDLSSWQLAFTGAEPVRAETLLNFAETFKSAGFCHSSFYPCYGMAETTLIVSGGDKKAMPVLTTLQGKALEQNQVINTTATEAGSVTLVGCGQTVEGQQIVIVDPETLKGCNSDEIGEIWVSGKSIAQGYWRRETQTEETFHAYLGDTNEGPFLRTGDLGFLQDGELFVTGRLKDLIIIRGRNHYPQDIELTVQNSHIALREGCVAAFAVDVEGEEQLVITQEIKRNYLRNLDSEAVISAIRKAVLQNHELQPFAILLLKTGSIPKTSSGKIQRHACKSGFLQESLNVVGSIANVGAQRLRLQRRGDTETRRHGDGEIGYASEFRILNSEFIQAWLVEKIAERLGISPNEIDIREPFASYGLDSLQAIRLSAELEDWLGRKLSPTLVYDYPTIEALAKYLSQQSIPPTPLRKGGSQESEIAIIGMGCRFPGANNPDAFWQLLRNGKDAITQVRERWEGDDWGGFIEQVDQFDPKFFGISPRETQEMDPQQRLLMEVSWEALENAGIAAENVAGTSTGVFVGISSSDYSQIRLRHDFEADAYAGTGNAHSIAANRLSYLFDFRGPSLTVDTACSSSLVAVHLAMRSLQTGECDQALAGGVNLILSPELTKTFTQAGMMAADGRCKTFDASADGYVRGEGCGVIVLKRLSDAISDGDNVLAILRGSAVNQDGRSNGLTAPNGLAQQAVIRKAIENAGVTPTDISYIETHGTGTSLGDPIEVNSLKTVLMQGRASEQPCWLGSVKTNIGHLEAAAGIAGLIKIILSFQHQEIAPHLHLQELNPHVDLENTSLLIPTQIEPWTRNEHPRLAGVSSFGFGGTNAHVILEEWELQGKRRSPLPSIPPTPLQKGGKREEKGKNLSLPLNMLTLSAKTKEALQALVKSYEEFLTSHEEFSLADICFTANTGRSHFNHRLAIIADSTAHLQEQLCAAVTGEALSGVIAGTVNREINSKITFLFTGQGSQYVGMGYQLYQTQPFFRATLERCAEILNPYLEKPLLEVLYPDGENEESKIDETTYTQPAIFALEYALAQLWQSWGIKPSIVMGHSVGEYVAACIAGVFSLEDGLKLIAERAKLMQTLPQNGEMVAIFASEQIVQAAIESNSNSHLLTKSSITIAAINGSQSVVISGEKAAITKVVTLLKSQSIKTKKLKVSHAFHSPLMEPILEDFEQVALQIEYLSPQLPIVSNLTGKQIGSEIATPEYWVNHVREPVQFAASMEFLDQEGYQIFLEIGSKPTLLGMARSILENRTKIQTSDFRLQTSDFRLWLPSLRAGQEDWQQILHSLGLLFIQGIKIDWHGFYQGYLNKRISLPTYPFQRQRYWLEPKNSLVKVKSNNLAFNNDFYKIQWQPSEVHTSEFILQNSEFTWLIFADQGGLGETLAQQLEKHNQQCLLVYPGDSYSSATHQQNNWQVNPSNPEDFQRLFQEISSIFSLPLNHIIYLWSLGNDQSETLTIASLEQAQKLGCGSILNIIQALSKQAIYAQLWIMTRGVQLIETQQDLPAVAQSPLWGLGKVIALEHPEYWGGIFDLDSSSNADEADYILKEIINADADKQIAFRNGQRYVPRLQKVKKENVKSQNINAEGSYLITGGLGSLGLKVAQWLVEQGAKNLVLLGRNNPSEKATKILQILEQQGVKILVTQADVSIPEDITKVLENIETSMPPLRGIIHAAGVLDDSILQGLSWERFAKVMSPKVQGTWNLHHLTQHLPLDFFILFSSAASLLGSPGQGNYAAANAFLDAIAYYRRSMGLTALSINWGPLRDGMATATRLAVKGINLMETEPALQALCSLISQDIPQLAVISVNWEILRQQFPDLVQSPYFQEILESPPQQQSNLPEKISIFKQILALSSVEREKFLISYLQSSLAQILQMESEKISPSDSLLDLGMDSLMVMEAINQLKGDLQLMLYPREFYERPKIEALAKYLAVEFERSHERKAEVGETRREGDAERGRHGERETWRRGDAEI